MAKKKPATQPESVTIRYDLHELPTAQHKAGLAGLLLQIDSMNERKEAAALPMNLELPTIIERAPAFVGIRFTERGTQNLFNDLYDAEVVEQSRKQKAQKRNPRRIEEVEVLDQTTGKTKKEKKYVYDVVQPIGHFLRRYTDDGKESWHKLWREMLFTIPRNQDATLGPFKDMAQLRLVRGDPAEWDRMEVTRRKNDKCSYLHCREGLAAWEELLRFERERKTGALPTVPLSGALLLGIQEKNPESLPCEDRIDHALLLHFWPLTVRVYVPELINREGKREFVGFVLAVPEVNDILAFGRAYLVLLSELKPGISGYRPAESVISLPAQGSLEFLHQLAELADRKMIQEGPARYISNVEFFYMVKIRNNVKTMGHGRVPPRDNLLRLYAGIRNNYRNPIFQSVYLLAALRGTPWYAEFQNPLNEKQWSFFVHSIQEKHRTPQTLISFAWDANQRFNQIERNYQISKGAGMTEAANQSNEVDRLVYQLVGKYVKARACAKAGISEEEKEWWRISAEERRDVCSKLFLELRSRNGDDFVRHFTATLGSVPQWLDAHTYLDVAGALMRTFAEDRGESRPRTRDDVKTLTLLALSAHSRSLSGKSETEVQTPEHEENAE